MDRRVYSFTARVDSGELKISLGSLKKLKAAIKTWRRCVVTVTIAAAHATRTRAQNAWYFGGVLRAIEEHTGQATDDLHEFFKGRFLPRRIVICDAHGVIKGEIVIGGSTRGLDKVQFSDYVERVRQFAAEELDLDIPGPEGRS